MFDKLLDPAPDFANVPELTNRSATPAPTPNTLDDEPRLNVPRFRTSPPSLIVRPPDRVSVSALSMPATATLDIVITRLVAALPSSTQAMSVDVGTRTGVQLDAVAHAPPVVLFHEIVHAPSPAAGLPASANDGTTKVATANAATRTHRAESPNRPPMSLSSACRGEDPERRGGSPATPSPRAAARRPLACARREMTASCVGAVTAG